jgi:hypothetical protein
MVDAGEEGLLALKLKDARYVIDVMPPAVPGQVRGEGEEESVPAENVILFNPKTKSMGQGYPKSDSPPWPFHDPTSVAPSPCEPSSSVFSPPGLFAEPEPSQGPQTLEELQEYFAGAGLGGQALVQFATEVARYTRREGLYYKNEPRLLLVWGERKFTDEENLPEVIESLARAEWLVLNGIARVHEEPGFGRCLKLEKRETTLFWRLVWKLRDANHFEQGADASFEGASEEAKAPQSPEPGAGPQATPESNGEPAPLWVSEVMAMLADGPVDYAQVEELVKGHTGRQRKIMDLVSEYFLVNIHEGKLAVLGRKS